MIWLVVAALVYGLFIHRGSYIKNRDEWRDEWGVVVEFIGSLLVGAAVVFCLYCLLRGFGEMGMVRR